jgi:hypothetical protein
MVDFKTMPYHNYKFRVNYLDCGTKFCVLKPIVFKRMVSVASVCLPTFFMFGPLAILQSYHGREISGQSLDSRMMALDNEVTFIFCFIAVCGQSAGWLEDH